MTSLEALCEAADKLGAFLNDGIRPRFAAKQYVLAALSPRHTDTTTWVTYGDALAVPCCGPSELESMRQAVSVLSWQAASVPGLESDRLVEYVRAMLAEHGVQLVPMATVEASIASLHGCGVLVKASVRGE